VAFEGRRVVLGVSGGIAAYKAVEVCRRLMDGGAYVSPVLTKGSTRFIGPTTFSALASEPARLSLFDDPDPIPHTSLGQGADVVVVAPATARIIGTYAAGISNDLLTATLLATRAPVVLAPAMHTEMWEHPAVQENLETLRRRGVHIVPPEEGRLAGGDIGKGRLAAPETIVATVAAVLDGSAGSAGSPGGNLRPDLAGLHVVVTAGGTREPIDPVRYIGNRSTGKQGYACAEEAAARGAKVTLITTVDRPVPAGVDVVAVETAEQMSGAVEAALGSADIVVMAAAVADFRPARLAGRKLKKDQGPPELVLEPTPDILAGIGARKQAGLTVVGFAAETHEMRKNALSKLTRKGADLIVANDVSAPGAGFGHDTNQVTFFSAGGVERELPLSEKRAVARSIFDEVLEQRSNT
jgi:phosphopantothenoylcysteine decarboxylase / phosphopantothenate---cysteine ligase